MGNDNKKDTRTVPVDDLIKIYSDIDAFRQIMAGDVMKRTGTLYMTNDYEGLDAVCGALGALIDAPGFLRNTVDGEASRDALKNAYGKAAACADNAVPDSELEKICLSLCSCWYTVLNDTYDPGQGSDEAIGRALAGSRYVIEMLDGLEAAGRASFEKMAKDPGGPLPNDFIKEFRDTAAMLQPRYDPGKQNNQKEDEA